MEHLPFVGRKEELDTLRELVTAAQEGHGRLVEIVGEPGVGKSRLVVQLRELAAGMEQLSAVCERYDSSTPYHVVRGLLRGLLQLPAEGSDEAIAQRFLGELATRAPTVLPWAPLIAGAIDLPVPETRETNELEDEFRRVRLAEAIIELVAHLLPHGGLLTVEEAHFMDQASAELFGRLTAAIGTTSWLICVTRRDLESGSSHPRGRGPDRARTSRCPCCQRARPGRHARCAARAPRAQSAGRALRGKPALFAGTDCRAPGVVRLSTPFLTL